MPEPEPEDVRDPDHQSFRDEHQQERNTEFYDILEQVRHDAHHRQLGFDLEGSKKELKRQKVFIKLTSLGFVASVTFLVTALIRRKRNRE